VSPGLTRAGLWLLLLVVGQIAALQLVAAGPFVRYQHYIPLARLAGDAPPLALALVALHLAAVAAGVAARRRELALMIRDALPGWRLGALIVGVVATSATLSRDPAVYAQELLLAGTLCLAAALTAALASLELPDPALESLARWADRLLGAPSEGGDGPALDRFTLAAAGWTALVAWVLGLVAYQQHPHVPDEVVYLLHARYFAAGRLWLPAPPVPEAFDVNLLTYEPDRMFSPVPVGWPAVLALGAAAGAPWLVNPLLAGLNVVLASRLLRAIYPRRTARLIVLLLCASPWHLFMAMNVMTHELTLTAALVGAVAVARLRAGAGGWWALAGGAGIGMVGLIRPLEGFATAGLLGLWSLGARGRRVRFAPTALLALASAATAALVLPYNRAMTGSATRFPIMAYTDRYYGPGTNALGFGADRGLGWPGLDPFPGHGPVDVVVNANFNTFAINVELLGWAAGSLAPVLLLLLLRGIRRRPADLWMILAALAIAGIHSFYWFSGGPDFGARYWYLALVPLLALAGRGLEEAALLARARSGRPGAGTRVGAAALALSLAALIVFVPWRAADRYVGYRGMRPDIRRLAEQYDFGTSLVLVRGRRHPDYASAATYNPLDLFADAPVYAWDRGPEARRRLAEAYPDRTVWIVDGPTVTGDGYRVVAGPLPPGWLAVDQSSGPPAGDWQP
jgi:hypothetical protein